MKNKMLFLGILLATGSLLAACTDCLEGGSNGFPDPTVEEFQLVFSNIVTRETEVFVDGQLVGTVCQATENATIGNFPVSTETEIKFHSMISGNYCYESPNCSFSCDNEACWGPPILDTTPFAGRPYVTGLIWKD